MKPPPTNVSKIVLADGSIRQISYKSDPDLFFALRGGGNNFGIVTRFDVATYPQGNMWGGLSYFWADATPAFVNALVNYNLNVATDPNACVIVTYLYYPEVNQSIFISYTHYAKPVADSQILQNFTSIPGSWMSTTRIDSVSNFTKEFESLSSRGLRQLFWTLTVKSDAQLLADIFTMYDEAVLPIRGLAGIVPAIAFQSMSTTMISHFAKNGGNALGVNPSDGPLIRKCNYES